MATTQEFRISDTLWERLWPKLPVHVPKAHPLGCHKRRVPDRQVLDGIFCVLHTGYQWKALSATGICSGSTAHARFQEWVQAGIFAQLWDVALPDYEDLIGLDFDWMALDGSLHKAPLGGKKTGPNPPDRGKGGVKRSLLTEAQGIPVGLVLEGANRHDMKLPESTLQSLPPAAEAARQAHLAAGRRRACAWRRATTTPRCGRWWRPTATRPTFARAGKKSKPKRPGKKPGAGWWSARTPGSTAFAICSFAGLKSRKITWLCFLLLVPE